ncbi:MAG TPA: hypothetical protein VF721_04695 [Pyrinomonadaceae bacterium]|jgi:hypothetical protein
MKETFLFVAFLFAFTLSANVRAQVTPPPGAGDKDLRDTNIKGRSNELERIDREARKDGKNSKKTEAEEDRLAAKFSEIKEDFETIQTAQAAIVSAYTTGEKISYAQIAQSAAEVNKKAARLKANLFAPLKDEKSKEKKSGKKEEKPLSEEKPISKDIRELIVDLDNAVGAVVSSPMFQNLRVIDPKVAEKTKSDLETVIKLSDALKIEAEKSNAGQK